MHEKRHFLSYRKRRHDSQITWRYAYYVTLGSRCKMASSSSEDETDTLPERPTWIQPYQFEPVRQDYERAPEHRVSFEANSVRYSIGFAKSHSLKCSLHKWAWCGAARKSARLNCINLIHFHLTAGRLRGSSCIAIPGVVCYSSRQHSRPAKLTFFVDHTHTVYWRIYDGNRTDSQTDVTSGKSRDWWRTRDCSLGQLHKIKSIKNPIKKI